jgi:hypothetical protein
MDFFEANIHALQSTPHRCTSATSGCDGSGCARNTQSISGGYGPGSSYKINTQNPFTVSQTYHETNGQLSSITTVISQGSNSITMTHDSSCGSGYLQGMTNGLAAGMVPTWSTWGGNMAWLDSPACSSESCSLSSSAVFSGLTITGAGTVTAPPPPPPTVPGSQSCPAGTVNANWVEFFPPAGANGGSSVATSVACSGTTYTCTWFAAGGKYQCSGSGTCNNPIPYYNGKPCPFPSSVVADQSTTSSSSSQNGLTVPIAAVAGLAVGCAVLAIALVIVLVLLLKKKPTEEYA